MYSFSLVGVLNWTNKPLFRLNFFPCFARIWLLTCVDSQVFLQTWIILKVFPTCVTYERLFTCLSIRVNLWHVSVVYVVAVTSALASSLLWFWLCISSWSWVSMLASFLILALSFMRVGREELVVTVCFWYHRGYNWHVELLVRENLLLLTDMLLWELWRDRQQKK